MNMHMPPVPTDRRLYRLDEVNNPEDGLVALRPSTTTPRSSTGHSTPTVRESIPESLQRLSLPMTKSEGKELHAVTRCFSPVLDSSSGFSSTERPDVRRGHRRSPHRVTVLKRSPPGRACPPPLQRGLSRTRSTPPVTPSERLVLGHRPHRLLSQPQTTAIVTLSDLLLRCFRGTEAALRAASGHGRSPREISGRAMSGRPATVWVCGCIPHIASRFSSRCRPGGQW